MKYLHSWIQEYIEDGERLLPKGEDFVNVISTNAFEVEEWYKIENEKALEKIPKEDYIYDLNILPNRAHDALSHYYMAKEVATLFNLKIKDLGINNKEEYLKDFSIKKSDDDFIKISDQKSCTRFMGAKVSGVVVKDSPDFIKYRLESIGQKSINNIVDIANYVQFAFNKPMHTYDANLVDRFLEARFANEGESMTTLDEKELNLDENTLVIADTKNVLSLAGIKGGKFSGINENTKNIILESANFNSTLIRKTSNKYNLKTDSSKRFENGISDDLVLIGMIETLKLLKEYATGENFSIVEIVDNFPKGYHNPYSVGVSQKEINNILGTNLESFEIEEIFKRFDFKYWKVIPREIIEKLSYEVEGKPYHLGASVRYDSPNMFDCSSLLAWLYKESGVSIPRISVDQFLFTNRIEVKDLRFGDLIFVNNDVDKVWHHSQEYMRGIYIAHGINHVGMYLGNGKVIHATKMFGKVVIENLGIAERFKDIVGYGRVLESLEEERFVVEIPSERLDLRIKEDIIEEIGRVYGLNNIKSVLPIINKTGKRNQNLIKENIVRNILIKNGFSEIITYTLRNKGDIEILKSVAKDKNYLRTNLLKGISESIQKNIFNMPILNIEEIKVFEFGNCFSLDNQGNEKEWRSLAIGIDDGNKNKNYKELKEKILKEVKEELGIEKIDFVETKNEKQKENIFEINFDELVKNSKEVSEKALIEINDENIKYKSFALTPFIVRDIACWVNENVNENEIEEIIKNNISALCISINLFDKFEKEIDGVKKRSFAFRLIYQDKERTLTDEEINLEADKIYNALKEGGFEVR